MKNFITIGTHVVFASLFSSVAALDVQAASCEFLANAPDQHVVVKGDTLWDISGRFLEHPWCWAQVWGMNREQIRNPHWIYPNQIIYLDRAAGRLRLGAKGDQGGDLANLPTIRLAPQVRIEALGKDAVPSIPPGVIEPFLSQPLIIEADEMKDAPRIVATQEGRVYLGQDDKAYVRGDLKGGATFQVFRPAKPLTDPVSKVVIGYEAFYLGSVTLQAEAKLGAEVATLPPNVIRQLFKHPLTASGLAAFTADWAKTGQSIL